MDVLRAGSLEPLEGIAHAFSFSLRTPEDHDQFARAAGVGGLPLLRLSQVHGDAVVRADATRTCGDRPDGDAFVATEPGIAIAVASADCVPILLADPEAGVVAAVHAGWRGMRARVLVRALEAMTAAGARPERLRAAIGPAVQGSCYEVGDEVRAEFTRSFPGAETLFDGRRLDLVRAARLELERGGMTADAVSVLALCTHCRPELASYRREGTARGTNLAVIALTPRSSDPAPAPRPGRGGQAR